MTEQPNGPERPATADEARARRSADSGDRPGAVRTEGETAVDDALGTGDNVH
jgi:hypothetical protein